MFTEVPSFLSEVTLTLSDFNNQFTIQPIVDDVEGAEPFDIAKHPALQPVETLVENMIEANEALLEDIESKYDAPCLWSLTGSEEDGYYLFSGISKEQDPIAYFVTEEAVEADYVVEIDLTGDDVSDEDDDEIIEGFNPDFDD